MIRFASTSPILAPDHLGQLQRLLVQRLAGDGRLAAEVAQRPDVVGGRARRRSRSPGASVSVRTCSYRRRSGPSSVPSRAIAVTRYRGRAGVVERGRSPPRAAGPSSVQPSHHHVAAAHVDRRRRSRSANSSTARATNAGSAPRRSCRGSPGPRRARAPPRCLAACGCRRRPAPGPRRRGRSSRMTRGCRPRRARRPGRPRAGAGRPPPGTGSRPRRGRPRRRSPRSGSPRSSRTARPPRRSIAGIDDHARHLPHEALVEREPGVAGLLRVELRREHVVRARPRPRTCGRARWRRPCRRPRSGANECTK